MENQLTTNIGSLIKRTIPMHFDCGEEIELITSKQNYWSIILIYKVNVNKPGMSSYNIFCKIPKSNWGISTIDAILTDDFSSSKEMAEIEFSSLRYLYEKFEKCCDSSLKVIEPLGYLPEYNAILTKGVNDSSDVFKLLRSYGNRNKTTKNIQSLSKQMGLWLGHFHSIRLNNNMNGFKAQASFLHQMQELRNTVTNLNDRELAHRILKYIDRLSKEEFDNISTNDSAITVGFEVRNFVTDKEAIYYLDAGEIRSGSAYEDIASFLVSVSLLYWGTINFLRTYRNEEYFVQTFLSSYQDKCGKIEPHTLSIYLAREYLKQWIDGIKVLNFKRLWKPLNIIIQNLYIERFFSNRLDSVLSTIESN